METQHNLVGDASYDSNVFGCSSCGWHPEGGKEHVSSLLYCSPWGPTTPFSLQTNIFVILDISFTKLLEVAVAVAVVKPFFWWCRNLGCSFGDWALGDSSALVFVVVVSSFTAAIATFAATLPYIGSMLLVLQSLHHGMLLFGSQLLQQQSLSPCWGFHVVGATSPTSQLGVEQCSGRFLGITGWNPSIYKSNRLHVHILRFSFVKFKGYIL